VDRVARSAVPGRGGGLRRLHGGMAEVLAVPLLDLRRFRDGGGRRLFAQHDMSSSQLTSTTERLVNKPTRGQRERERPRPEARPVVSEPTRDTLIMSYREPLAPLAVERSAEYPLRLAVAPHKKPGSRQTRPIMGLA
jgi:hypothetical protein